MKKLLLMLLLCQGAFAQLSTTQIDSLTNDALKRFNTAGCAVAIVKDGKIIHSKGYGVKSISTKEPVTDKTNFAIASNSKAFTCAALAILVDEGKMAWTDKVKKYIPEFKMYNDYVTENFTIEDLLTHRSGLGLGAGDLIFFPAGGDFTITDLLNTFQYQKPQSAFRTKFDYDNLLYVVAGEVIKRATGQTWEQFVQARIFIPLGMGNTSPSFAMLADKSSLATPHADTHGTLKEIPQFEDMMNGAAGGILANVSDLTQWLLVQLNKGKYGDKKDKTLFSPQSSQTMWTIHTVTDRSGNPRYNTHFSGYGLGWQLSDMKGNMVVQHTGGLPGMLSITTIVPDLNLGIVVLTNTADGGYGAFSAITNTLLDSYMGLDDFKWAAKYEAALKQRESGNNEAVDKIWKTVKASAKTKVNAADYIGIYEDPWFGKAEIFMKGKQLWFKSLRSPKLNGPMQLYKANTFAIKWEYQDMPADAFAMFSLDEEGKAIGIKLKPISEETDFSFDFQDLDFKRVESKK
ncbi:serine hydrolase [Flavobacterium psychrotrophum]|uniref:serine hydrolase n=1 Tax=Flavobacterium psychrotrophum TaxID=2294119 RepID=UPI000E31B50B|nr:serine hydrolase [Flavobacterium psychrotrophum]